MKYGWLVVNAYLKSEKFDEIYQYLIKAAEKRECTLEVITNEQVHTGILNSIKKRPEFAIFWDKDVRAARLLEINDIRIYNSSEAIEICDDKSRTYLELLNSGITMPDTIISPLNYGIKGDEKTFVDNAIKIVGLPLVIKENCGSFGAQVYMANSKDEALQIIDHIEGGYIVQKFISTSKGRDVRIHMVGDKFVTAMLRENVDDFRANITNGGKMKPYTPMKEQLDMARTVCQKLKLDFAGVDIMFGENDEPVFCEVNSNAHFKNIFDCTGVNVADYILEYVLSGCD